MMKRKLVPLLLMTVCLQVGTSTPVQLNLDDFNYDGRQIGEMALVTTGMLARLAAGYQPYDLSGRKKAWLGKLVATLTIAARYMIDPQRDLVSKGAHANAALWQLLKQGEEFRLLRDVSNVVGDEDELSADASTSLLKKHYYGADEEAAFASGGWADGIDDGVDNVAEVKKLAHLFLILASWGGSLYSIHSSQTSKTHWAIGEFVRAASDLLLRYVMRDGEYKSTSNIGKLELVSCALPHVWDIGKNAIKFTSYQAEDEAIWVAARAAREVERRRRAAEEIEREIERQRQNGEPERRRREEAQRKREEDRFKAAIEQKKFRKAQIEIANQEIIRRKFRNGDSLCQKRSETTEEFEKRKTMAKEKIDKAVGFMIKDFKDEMPDDCLFCGEKHKRFDTVMLPCCLNTMHAVCYEKNRLRGENPDRCPFCRKTHWVRSDLLH